MSSTPQEAPTRFLRFPGPFLTAAWNLNGRFPTGATGTHSVPVVSLLIIRLVFRTHSAKRHRFLALRCGNLPRKTACTKRQVFARVSLNLTLRSRSTSWAAPANGLPPISQVETKTLLGGRLDSVGLKRPTKTRSTHQLGYPSVARSTRSWVIRAAGGIGSSMARRSWF